MDASVGINYLAVLAGALAYWVLGAIWYCPPVFGNSWMASVGKSKEQLKAEHSPMNYVWGFVTAFVASYGIARIMVWMGGDTWADGIRVALVAGICFVTTTLGVSYAFEGRPKSLWIINSLYHVVGFVLAGVIVGLWR